MKATSQETRWSLFRIRPFRLIFIGSSVSKVGDGLIPVAFSLTAYHISGSASGITAVLISLWLSRFLTVPIGGRVADALDRLTVAIFGDALRIIAQGGLALTIAFLPGLNIWHLCASASLYGIGTGFYIPAQIGLVPSLVPHARLRDANSMLSIATDVTLLAGPALSGLAMAKLGFQWILVIDCISFVVNGVCLGLLMLTRRTWRRAPDPTQQIAHNIASEVPASFLASLRLLRSFPWFSQGLMFWFVLSFGIGVVAVAGPVISVRSLGGVLGWALLSTCLAVGSLLGSLVVASARRSIPWRIAVIVAAIAFSAQLLALLLGGTLILPVIGIAFVAGSGAVAIGGIIWTTEYQHAIPESVLSRLGSVESFVNSVGIPVGMVAASTFAGHLEIFLSTIIAAVLSVGLLAGWRPVPTVPQTA